MEPARKTRSPLLARLNAWRKRSPFSPYWLDWMSLRASVARLAGSSKGVLLDVGCSERPYAALFAPHVRRHVGLDYPPALLAKQPELWEILDRAKRSVDVFGDGHRLPFCERSFDTVLATEVLEHVLKPGALLAEMARVLKPEGRLLLTVPFVQPLHERPLDYYRYTPFALEKLVEESGLVVERIEARGNYASALGALVAQFVLRACGSGPWRGVFVFPAVAVVQTTFYLLSKFTRDDALALGYCVVARKPAPVRRHRIRRCQPDRAGRKPTLLLPR